MYVICTPITVAGSMDQHGLDLLKVLKYQDPISIFNFFMSGKRETYLTTPYHDNQFVYKASIIWNEKVFKKLRVRDMPVHSIWII